MKTFIMEAAISNDVYRNDKKWHVKWWVNYITFFNIRFSSIKEKDFWKGDEARNFYNKKLEESRKSMKKFVKFEEKLKKKNKQIIDYSNLEADKFTKIQRNIKSVVQKYLARAA